MYETLTRTHDPVPLVPALKPISSAIDRIKAVEVKKGRRRDLQILEAKRKREEKEQRAREEGDAVGELPDPAAGKRRRLSQEQGETDVENAAVVGEAEGEELASASTTRLSTPQAGGTLNAPSKADKEYVLKPSPYTKGHTSYLTFAVLLPLGREVKVDEPEAGIDGEVEVRVVEREGSDIA